MSANIGATEYHYHEFNPETSNLQDPDESITEDSQPPQLTEIELRVLGALMEKQLTTPDQYPLTVNSILAACNQKSSREPITNYQQGEVVRALQGLEDRNFVRKEYGSRADKYSQWFIKHLELGKKQQALLCLMMLRGPQTLSELHTRTQRTEQFGDKNELTHCIERLCERKIPYAIRLGSQPGQRGERFGHLFSGIPDIDQMQPNSIASVKPARMSRDDKDILSLLESDVDDLRKAVQELRNENRILKDQLDSLYRLTGNATSQTDKPDFRPSD